MTSSLHLHSKLCYGVHTVFYCIPTEFWLAIHCACMMYSQCLHGVLGVCTVFPWCSNTLPWCFGTALMACRQNRNKVSVICMLAWACMKLSMLKTSGCRPTAFYTFWSSFICVFAGVVQAASPALESAGLHIFKK